MTCRPPITDPTRLRFRLSITADTFEAYYRGRVQQVQVRSSDGRLVRLPASALRPFLTHAGIDGEFELTFDQHSRLIDLKRLDG